jgi:phosphoribosylaminoimidazolecarboxamide formyltransferase/IMP cyclohydrolase
MKSRAVIAVPGGVLEQESDENLEEELINKTRREFSSDKNLLARFGIWVCRSLKSNAIALVREIPGVKGGFQLVGAGQGQPNRVEALEKLAVPRAQAVLRETGGRMSDCIMISDAFFPFRDTVDRAYTAGIRFIVQPGGSLKDQESIQACDEHEMAMVFTGVRHFRH